MRTSILGHRGTIGIVLLVIMACQFCTIRVESFLTSYSSSYLGTPRSSNLTGRRSTLSLTKLFDMLQSPDDAASPDSFLPKRQNQTDILNEQRDEIRIQDLLSALSLEEENTTIQEFNMGLNSLAPQNPLQADAALALMESLQQKYPDDIRLVQPTSASYTTVIEAYCYHWIPPSSSNYTFAPNFAAERAQALLDHMEQHPNLKPNELSYVFVCQKWAEAVKTETVTGANAQKAHEVLLRLQKQSFETSRVEELSEHVKREPVSRGNNDRSSNTSTQLYNIVLEAWCRRVGHVPQAMDKVEEILLEMETSGPSPNVWIYTSVIAALAQSKQDNLATKASKLMARIRSEGIEPDMYTFTSLLNCWAKTRDKDERKQAATQARAILQEMESLYLHKQQYQAKPSQVSYNTAIRAIGNSLDKNAPEIAQNILEHMYKLTEAEDIQVPPTTMTYNSLIMSLSTAMKAQRSLSRRRSMARRAEYWLSEMTRRSNAGEERVKPNVKTWGAVLRAWADSGLPDSGEQAQRVLDLLQQSHDKNGTAVRPNVVCFTTTMTAWARGTAPAKKALSNVDNLLLEMERRFEETGDLDVRPNKISYITAIDAYCRKSKEKAAPRAQALVDRMVHLYSLEKGYDRPTRIIFNALINAYSKSNDTDAAVQAEEIFRWMESRSEAGDKYLKPDYITLCAVLDAWANQVSRDGALRAQQILEHAESLPLEKRGFRLSVGCHNILIKAWGRSRAPDCVQQAEKILLNLEKRCESESSMETYGKPDVTTYSSVINCCAYFTGDEHGKEEALSAALRTFDKLQRTKEGPNSITYGTLFKAIAKLAPDGIDKEKLVSSLFEKCTSQGLVDSFVLSQVKAASTQEQYRKLVLQPAGLVEQKNDRHKFGKVLSSIPKDWCTSVTRHV